MKRQRMNEVSKETARTETVEKSLSLGVSQILEVVPGAPGGLSYGSIETCRPGFEEIEIVLDWRDENFPNLEIRSREVVSNICLDFTRPNFGGRRWWLLCPFLNHRISTVYQVDARGFGSRSALGISYGVWRENAYERSLRRLRKLRSALMEPGEEIPCAWSKPPGMTWRRFERIRESVAKELETNRTLLAPG